MLKAMMRSVPMPCHLKLEMERRPRAARRLGRVTVPPPHPVMQPPQGETSSRSRTTFLALVSRDRKADSIFFSRFFRASGPHRETVLCASTPSATGDTDVTPCACADIREHDLAAHRLEVERRPVAAKRQGLFEYHTTPAEGAFGVFDD
mmetsp:Transcript_28552/g.45817  ORF Transcript_28552/g.45817 Transcript_28552/m.45817 type:complete len:149 (+) Transcript_28552:442-888(+)